MALLRKCTTLLLFPSIVLSVVSVRHPCDRECEWPQKPKRCEYDFTVEWFYTMSKACHNCPFNLTDCTQPHCIAADGYRRPIISVNRQLPGPAIRVCHNDTIVVNLHNQLENGEGVTIHWHGLYMRDTPHMDGVPMLTQCPIPAKTSFSYVFRADPPGTHWWHSHAGMQRADGCAGPLIVTRAKEEDPHFGAYDFDLPEHVVSVGDWLHQMTLQKFLAHHHSFGDNKGESLLINGKGVSEVYTDVKNNKTHLTPREIFKVTKGNKYRFRTISNAAVFCPCEITVDNHNLTIIASDGADFEPYTVTSLVVHGGERFDFIISATEEVSNYWFRVQGLADCRNQSQNAILRYEGALDEIPNTTKLPANDKTFLQLNPWNQRENENFSQISSMIPIYSKSFQYDQRLKGSPDQTHFLGFDFMKVNNPLFHHPEYYPIHSTPRSNHLYTPQINNITFVFPQYPMLTQHEYVTEEELCDPDSINWNRGKFCRNGFCSCPYIIDVKIGNLVELVVYDEGWTFDAGHPMHLHGQHFAVVAMERVGRSISSEDMKAMHSNGSVKYNFNGVLKDTVIIPDGGYTILRFVANNPGVWMFHCHLAFHSQIGMELVFRVGKSKDWIKPPADFPMCGNWPSSYKSEGSTLLPNSKILSFSLLISLWLF